MGAEVAIGIAAGIIAFLDFSWKLTTGANELYDSRRQVSRENARIREIIEDLRNYSFELQSEQLGSSRHEQALKALSTGCYDVCQELIAILDTLKARRNSRWAALRVTWAGMRQRKEVAHIEGRLAEYRMEINTRLLALLNEHQSSVKKQLDDIQTEAQNMSLSSAEELKLLRAEFIKLLAKPDDDDDDGSEGSTTATSDDSSEHEESPSNIREHLFDSLSKISVKIDHLSSLIRSTPREACILHHLYFEGIYNRIDSIVDPSEGTFEWIFFPTQTLDHLRPDEKFLSRQAEQRERASQKFLNWLRGDGRLFYVSGKAGCGKSTLLKFMANHQKTRTLLQQWAGDRTVAIASFFFWQSDGQKLQMTLDGMYRSILFFILRHCPRLIPDVLPKQWEATDSEKRNAVVDSDLYRAPSIKAAFERLMNLGLPSDDVRFCLFIDGLDEYKADAYDQKLFAMKLRDWAEGSLIKICVSSRPEVHFLNTFRSAIHLHEITQGDIYLSTRDTFEHDSNFDHISSFYLEFVEKIVWSADGVFLWARLVARALLEEAEMHSSYERLCQKLDSTPTQLSNLYKSMLSSMPRDDRTKIRSLLILVATNPFKSPLHTSVFDYINASGDVDLQLLNQRTRYTTETLLRDQERVGRQLQGLTRGILVTVPSPSRDNPMERLLKGIGFFHKTVKDYILSSEQAIELNKSSPCSDFPNTHALLRMAEVTRISHLMSKHEQTKIRNQLLDIFTIPSGLEIKTLVAFENIWVNHFAHATELRYVTGSQRSNFSNLVDAGMAVQAALSHPFLGIAAYHGQFKFLRYRLADEPRRTSEVYKVSLGVNSQAATSKQPPRLLETPNNVLFPVLWKLTSREKNKDEILGRHQMRIKTLDLLLSEGFSMKERMVLMEQPTFRMVRDASLWIIFVFDLSKAVKMGTAVDPKSHLDTLRIILQHEKQENAVIVFRCSPAHFPVNYWREAVMFRTLTLHELLLVADPTFSLQKEGMFCDYQALESEAGSDDMLRSWVKGQKKLDFDESFVISRWTTSGLREEMGRSGYPWEVAGVVTKTDSITDQLDLVARLW